MASILIRQPVGIAPAIDRSELPLAAAQVADDCRFDKLTWAPWSDTLIIKPLPTIAGTVRSIYRAGHSGGVGPANYWCAWNADVDVVRAAIASDPFERTYYTGVGPMRYFDNKALSAVSNNPLVSYLAGIPAPTNAILPGDLAVSGPTTGTAEDRTYFVTFVNADGEEGPPSPPPRNASGAIYSAVTVYPGQTVTISNLPGPPAGAYNFGAGATKRIYRTTTGGVRLAGEVPIGTSTFVDDRSGTQLGVAIPSVTWDAPPADLTGLIGIHGGSMAGFVRNEVFFCPPYRPHAWPPEYARAMRKPIVGLGKFQQSVAVLTTGMPVVLSGTHPSSMAQVDLEGFPYACVSKRSIVEVAGGVAYACPVGYAWIGPGGPKLLTAGLFDQKSWAPFAPESIHAYAVGNKIIAFYDAGSEKRGFILDLSDQRSPFSPINLWADAGFLESERDHLYLAVGSNIVRWDAGSGALNGGFRWRSKRFVSRYPRTLSHGRVLASSYPVTLRMFSNDGPSPYFQRSVESREIFTLPSGRRHEVVEIEIQSSGSVSEVQLASSIDQFRQSAEG